MTISNQQIRPAWTAIAAVLALSATPAFAQEVTPDPTAPVPVAPPSDPVATTPVIDVAPTPDLPASDSPSAMTTSSDPLAPATVTSVTEAAPATRERALSRRTVKAAPRSVQTSKAVVEAPLAAAMAQTPPIAPETGAAMAAPLAASAPAAAESAPAADTVMSDDALPIAGAAGLGILALAGAGIALRRRKRSGDEETDVPVYEEPRMVRASEPVRPQTPSAAAPSASAWGQSTQPAEHAPALVAGGPGHHLAAARRGPTPENPFLSLKKRLKRASFYEQRDRLVAQGRADPVPATAGLPEALGRTARHARAAAMRPINAMSSGVSFNRTLQPA